MGATVRCRTMLAALLGLFASSIYAQTEMNVNADWLLEPDGQVLLDPQTSGLVSWRDGSMLTVADGSAHKSQVLKLIKFDPLTRSVQPPKMPIVRSDRVKQGCFAEFLSERPDLEALAVDPDDDSIFYIATEDASYYKLSDECQKKYQDTGSTKYPSLLLRLQLQDDGTVEMTHARAIQFDPAFNVGNLPNDGIEGLAFGIGHRLYLSLERDANRNARIFYLDLSEDFWLTDEFATVYDTKAKLPYFESGLHPINAMTYVPTTDNSGWLVAAARNDNQLWFVDPEGKKDTQVLKLKFFAETKAKQGECSSHELMNNYSMEGIAYHQGKLWIINDPWKQNYLKNVQCEASADSFRKMAPLISTIDMPL